MFQKHFISQFRETLIKISVMKSSAVKNGLFTGAVLRFFSKHLEQLASGDLTIMATVIASKLV